jgi:Sigma-70, region 4
MPGSRTDGRMASSGGPLTNGTWLQLGYRHDRRGYHGGRGAISGVVSVCGQRRQRTPEQQLRLLISALAGPDEMSAIAEWDHEPLGRALVFRLWPARTLHVVGDSPLAAEFRRLIMAGAAPGWDLHPVPPVHTPLHVLAGPLHQLSGSDRFYNLLERNGFAHVEEVAATPEGCLLQLRNSGPRFIAAVRQATAELHPGDAQAKTASLPGHGGAGQAAGGLVPPAGLPADAARALQVMAAWAVAEHGARILGDLLALTPDVESLPGDVARSWDCIRQLDLRTLAGAALSDRDLPQLAGDLLDELEERRRLILTSRTFAPSRRTYDSLAAELGVTRERVRQLETTALQQLARAAAHGRYRPLRWRAAAAPRPEDTHAAAITCTPPWMSQMLSWLAEQTA